jgi:hypothetical protein
LWQLTGRISFGCWRQVQRMIPSAEWFWPTCAMLESGAQLLKRPYDTRDHLSPLHHPDKWNSIEFCFAIAFSLRISLTGGRCNSKSFPVSLQKPNRYSTPLPRSRLHRPTKGRPLRREPVQGSRAGVEDDEGNRDRPLQTSLMGLRLFALTFCASPQRFLSSSDQRFPPPTSSRSC